jgi:multiple sugar transport system permease protein
MGATMARSLSSFLARAVLVFAAFSALFPVVWAFLNALKERVDLVTPVPKFIFSPTLDNFAYILSQDSVKIGLYNSVVIAAWSVGLGALFGIPCAYAIARYPVRGARDIQFFLLSLRFLPPVAIAIPMIVIWLDVGLYDTKFALVVTYLLMTLSIIIWLSIPAFNRVAPEIEEAAFIDGYGPYAVFWKVALPLARKSLIGAVVFSFVLVWNEFLMALMLTTSNARTLPVVASAFSLLGRDVPWGILNASVVLLSIPPLLFVGVLSQFLNTTLKKS